MARIALDAMGGDHAPLAPVEGALLALAELHPEHIIQLVGRSDAVATQLEVLLRGEYAMCRDARQRVELVHAPDVIEMTDKPAAAIRGKPLSSMVVGLRLQDAGASDAFVSAGNTGAQMAASTVILKLHANLTRPAIVTVFPTALQPLAVLDSGANVDCSALELLQFARLGSVYAQDMMGRPRPAVALLSIGEESEKGNRAVIEAHQLLRHSDLNFVGNAEGRDILMGRNARGPIDVIVCDGFTGNVLLKFYEAVPPLMKRLMEKSGIDPDVLASALNGFDYSDYGGAPLLGVRGVSIISHGSSSPRAIKNAIGVGVRAVESKMNEHIGRRLRDHAGQATLT